MTYQTGKWVLNSFSLEIISNSVNKFQWSLNWISRHTPLLTNCFHIADGESPGFPASNGGTMVSVLCRLYIWSDGLIDSALYQPCTSGLSSCQLIGLIGWLRVFHKTVTLMDLFWIPDCGGMSWASISSFAKSWDSNPGWVKLMNLVM